MNVVTIADVVQLGSAAGPVSAVILHDESGQRAMPIWIGYNEAISIALGLREAPTTVRPRTIEFIKGVLEAAGATVEDVRITALREGTFYAVTRIRNSAGTIQEIDARPSDALGLAVHTGRSVFVAEEVLREAGKLIPDGKQPTGRGLDTMLQQFGMPVSGLAPLPDPVDVAFGMQEAQEK